MRLPYAVNLAALLTLLFAGRVFAQPSTAPASLDGQLDALLSPNPLDRAAARDALMRLTRDDLPRLRQAAIDRGSVPPAMRAALREIVVHVYLTGTHNFTGTEWGRLGVVLLNEGGSPYVGQCRPGFDAARVLQPGDTIVGLTDPLPTEASDLSAFKPVRDYPSLLGHLGGTRVGQWVGVRVVRNGMPVDLRIRLGPNVELPAIGLPDPQLADGERYWTDSFAPQLPAESPAAATRPTTRP